MTRGLASANVTASTAAHVIPVLFVAIEFDSGTLRVHDTVGAIPWGGNTWNGGGAFVDISPIEESEDRSPYRVWMRLNAVDQDIIDEAEGQEVYQRAATVYLGFLGADGQLVATPDEWDSFWCDNFEISMGGEVDTITLNAESDRVRDDVPNGLMFSDEAQQSLYSGDTGFEFLSQMVDARVYWGKTGGEETAGVAQDARDTIFGRARGGLRSGWQ